MAINTSVSLANIETDTARVNFERGRKNVGSDKMDKASFMQLLLAQLKYQDPTSPMDNSQFVQQQAAFTQVERLEDLNKTINATSQLTQASSLVGKHVEIAIQPDFVGLDPTYRTGKVDSVTISGGEPRIKIDGLLYKMDQVTQVYSEAPTTQP